MEPSEPVDLRALIVEIAADAEFEAGARRCRVRVDAAGAVEVRGVRHLLRSAVENVVRNAVRYTAEDSEVAIELSTRAAGGNGHSPAPRHGSRARPRSRGARRFAGESFPAVLPRFRGPRSAFPAGPVWGWRSRSKPSRRTAAASTRQTAPDGGLIVEIVLPA